MHRRSLLTGLAAAAFPAAAALPTAAWAASAAGWRTFELTTNVDLLAQAAPVVLWLPLAGDAGAFQRGISRGLSTNGEARVVRDGRYREPLVRIEWRAPGPRRVTLIETLTTRDRIADGAPLTLAQRRFWTAPTASLPTDGVVGVTARRITAGLTEPHFRLRAIYDWVVDNTFQDPAVRGCGVGGIDAMLRTGFLGGKCADINGLMVGLARAAGIPARYAYGVRVGSSRLVKPLGASGDVTHAQHCRAEMWLGDQGWFPVDPADVRKLMQEANAPLSSPLVRTQRERLFGSWEMNWVAYNHATDIVLPGARAPISEHFLMYPCAMTPAGELDQLAPDTFRYRITSRELTP